MKEWKNNIVLENGQLNDSVIFQREPLYKGTNGRVVERFFITPTESLIFKPLTNNKQIGKEIWVQENILNLFPGFYPKIIAKSTSTKPENNWIIYSDLGNINHEFTYEILHEVIKNMAWWHSLPYNRWKNAPLNGPKPKIEEIKSDIVQNRDKITKKLLNLSVPTKNVKKFFTVLEKTNFSKELVMSHGDLHQGNYGIARNQLVILDWEYAHLNTRFWDLYHLIDLSHPLYPKTVTRELRSQILSEYHELAESYGMDKPSENFNTEYYLFAATFSLWMIMLIQNDLKQKDDRWPQEALRKQLLETNSSFVHCTEELLKKT